MIEQDFCRFALTLLSPPRRIATIFDLKRGVFAPVEPELGNTRV